MTNATWKGGIYRKGAKLWLRVKVDGKWAGKPTPFRPGQEDLARRLLQRVREKLVAGEEIEAEVGGPLTVRAYSRRWIAKRRALGIPDADAEDSHLRCHVLSGIGDMRLEEVRPRHLVQVVEQLRLAGKAPRTVRNVYSTCRSLFRDAALEDLVPASPCILTKHQIGTVRDKRSGWRAAAVFSRTEYEALISDPRVPLDRRVLYGLLGLAMLRHGEAAGLRWRHLELDARPLGRILVATSYDSGRTKTGAERSMPIHPALGALLAEWRLGGWARALGRIPGPDDLVVPVTPEPKRKGRRREVGAFRDKNYTWKRAQRDFACLGFRPRRVHDLRRTGISLAREDGADKDVLRRGTHAPPREVMELYTSVEWERLCVEVAKLKIAGTAPATTPVSTTASA